MKAIIKIDCETKAEFFTHISVVRQQFKQELKGVNDLDVIEKPVTVEDDNCYGSHEGRIIIGDHEKQNTFEDVFADWADFSLRTFPLAETFTTMDKLKDEADEVKALLNDVFPWDEVDREKLKAELVDCFLCLMNASAKAGFVAEEIVEGMHNKAQVNKARKWKYNGNGTYSHIKEDHAGK